jgi:hypothetical protein
VRYRCGMAKASEPMRLLLTALLGFFVGPVVAAGFVSGSLGVMRFFTTAVGILSALCLAFVLLDHQRTKLRPRAQCASILVAVVLLGSLGWWAAPRIPREKAPPLLTLHLDATQPREGQDTVRYRLSVYNVGPGQAEGVRVRVLGIDPYPRGTTLHSDLPYDLSTGTKQETTVAINETDSLLYGFFRWWHGETGARLVDGFGADPPFEMGPNDHFVVRVHVTAANAKALDRLVTLIPLENRIGVTLKPAASDPK